MLASAMNGALWYFAYGSNLDPRTFLGRRSMRPLATRCGLLRDFELCFDLPVGPGERGVANVRPRAGAHVWGVAYQLLPEECDRLDRTAGVPFGADARRAVELAIPDGGARDSFTFCSADSQPDR
jgi:hypothetical protein